jgi:uncharacterized membrane protein
MKRKPNIQELICSANIQSLNDRNKIGTSSLDFPVCISPVKICFEEKNEDEAEEDTVAVQQVDEAPVVLSQMFSLTRDLQDT